jgi:hypothetical protein
MTRVSLSSIDQYGEWLNPTQHPDIVDALTRDNGIGSYDMSISVLRGTRPSSDAYTAHVWWADPTNRAHLINALVQRGHRSIVDFERDADIRPSKTYSYLKSFRIRFRARPRRHVTAMDLHGDLHEANVVRVDPDHAATATLKLWGYPGEYTGTWSVANAAYRLHEPVVGEFGVLPVHTAAEVLGIHAPDLARVLWRIGIPSNGTVYLEHLTRIFPDPSWREDAHRALANHYEADAQRLLDTLDDPHSRAGASV